MPFPLIVALLLLSFIIFFPIIANISYIIEIISYRLGAKVDKSMGMED